MQAMKRVDEIKKARQQRFFDRRMAKAAAKKRMDIENELMTHVDSISDPKIKEFIREKKTEKLAAKRLRQENSGPRKEGVWAKDAKMEESSEEEVVVAKTLVQKIKAKKEAVKLTKKAIKK